MRAREKGIVRENVTLEWACLYDARMLIGGNGRKLARIGARGKGTEREHNWWVGEPNATKMNA